MTGKQSSYYIPVSSAGGLEDSLLLVLVLGDLPPTVEGFNFESVVGWIGVKHTPKNDTKKKYLCKKINCLFTVIISGLSDCTSNLACNFIRAVGWGGGGGEVVPARKNNNFFFLT